eukprot:1182253-Prorocentrum_minimum.AAC.4
MFRRIFGASESSSSPSGGGGGGGGAQMNTTLLQLNNLKEPIIIPIPSSNRWVRVRDPLVAMFFPKGIIFGLSFAYRSQRSLGFSFPQCGSCGLVQTAANLQKREELLWKRVNEELEKAKEFTKQKNKRAALQVTIVFRACFVN